MCAALAVLAMAAPAGAVETAGGTGILCPEPSADN
jgi:hypothetical protein